MMRAITAPFSASGVIYALLNELNIYMYECVYNMRGEFSFEWVLFVLMELRFVVGSAGGTIKVYPF